MHSRPARKLLLLALFAGAMLIAANAAALPPDIHVITIGTNGDGFEDDSGVSASGGEINGDVLVFINGNPVVDYRTGGVFAQINHYLRDGDNTIHLEGDPDKSLFVKVGLMAGPEFKRVVAKREFKPVDVSRSVQLKFPAEVPYRLAIFDPDNRIPADVSGSSLHPLLEQLAGSFAESDYGGAAALLLSQTRTWSELAYGQEKTQSVLIEQSAADYYRKKAFTDRPPSPESIRVVAGESVALVYSGIDDNGFFKSKTLGEFVLDGADRKPVPAMKMVYINGQWRIWD